ncbi:DUF2809 domain-containing protein [Lyngbya sp. CCAP 1446/10]|uniref:DUF2809 domain-containing protein n=1 Tax=Lyngbya sp. CCAP 1446/10 TaxID=439293 RepID=UPI0035C91F7E
MLKEWRVLICNSAIEFSKLWHPPFWQWIFATLFGSLFIGSGLACRGFFWYILGCIMDWFWWFV